MLFLPAFVRMLAVMMFLICVTVSVAESPKTSPETLLNVSYDVGRELFQSINASFELWWKSHHQKNVKIRQSHAGSAGQARAVVEGLQADVVTFVQWPEVHYLYSAGKLIPEDWDSRLPHGSSPYYSIPAFMVREGNPNNIRNWGDLAKAGVSVVFPNPATSGNGRYTWLAVWAWTQDQGMNKEQTEIFMRRLLGNVKTFPSGGRAATTTFVNRRQGDVLISFEAEILGVLQLDVAKGCELVVPDCTLQADFVVAKVNGVTNKNHSDILADGYLNYLYTPEAQQIMASHNYRVRDTSVMEIYAERFSPAKLLWVENIYGSWSNAMQHFESKGPFEQLVRKRG